MNHVFYNKLKGWFMATKRYYQLSHSSILLYYNLLGVDMRTIDINNLETEIDDLNDLAPEELYYGLPEISQFINREYLKLLEKICTSPDCSSSFPKLGAKKTNVYELGSSYFEYGDFS